MHDKFNPKIIHCDIKGSNILLNEDHEAFVADFGLAKLLGPDISHAFTQVRGTYGRIPPEYCYHYHISEKTDVYEFGFFLIELITASSSLDEGIIDVVWILPCSLKLIFSLFTFVWNKRVVPISELIWLGY